MITRLIIRLRLRSAARRCESLACMLIERKAEAEALHPESLHCLLIEREIDTLLMPEWEHQKQLVRELSKRLKAA